MSFIQMSISGSILILGIIIFRALAMHHVSKKVFVLLWGIALMRLLLPISISLNIPGIGTFAGKMLNEQKQQIITDDGMESEPKSAAVQETVPEANMIKISEDKLSTAVFLWITGVILSISIMIILYVRDTRLLKEAIPYTGGPILCLEGKKKIKLLLSDRISTPLTYGIFKPCIIIPKDMNQEEQGVLSYILQHELIHIRHCDNLWKMLAIMAACIHCYNPLVWIMLILVNRDLELRCDEEVIRLYGTENRKSYALTLLSFAEEQNNGFFAGVGFGKNAIKERLEAIMKYKKLTIAGAFLATVVITASLTVFITSYAAYGSRDVKEYAYELAEEKEGEKVYKVNMASVEYAGTAKTREEIYEPYTEAGIIYDKEKDRLFLGEKKIKELLDKEQALVYTVPDGEGYYEITYDKKEME